MAVLSVSKAKENLEAIVEEVQNSYEPMIISGKNHSAVLVSEEVWRSYRRNIVFILNPRYERIHYKRHGRKS